MKKNTIPGEAAKLAELQKLSAETLAKAAIAKAENRLLDCTDLMAEAIRLKQEIYELAFAGSIALVSEPLQKLEDAFKASTITAEPAPDLAKVIQITKLYRAWTKLLTA